MAEAGIFVHWTGIPRGREAIGPKVFAEALQYNEKMVATKQFESYTVQVVPGFGIFLLSLGEPDKIDAAMASEEFQDLVAKAGLVADNLLVQRTQGPSAIMAIIQRGEKARQALGL